ncbi:MAG: hypothetical protein V4583_02830 [Pseudomonadota bacterium]
MSWGVDDNVRERFGAAGVPAEKIFCARETDVFRNPGPPRELFGTSKKYYSPTMNAFEAATKDGQADQLDAELDRLFEHSQRGLERTEIPVLKVKTTKP